MNSKGSLTVSLAIVCPYVTANANAPVDIGVPVAITLAVVIVLAGVVYGIRQVSHPRTQLIYVLVMTYPITPPIYIPSFTSSDSLPLSHLFTPWFSLRSMLYDVKHYKKNEQPWWNV